MSRYTINLLLTKATDFSAALLRYFRVRYIRNAYLSVRKQQLEENIIDTLDFADFLNKQVFILTLSLNNSNSNGGGGVC